MNRQQIELVRSRVSCASVLVATGFLLDKRESTRRALKFRRGGEIIIVTHDGAGWFDPLSDNKGDVFALAGLLERIPFHRSVERVGGLAGVHCQPACLPPRSGAKHGVPPPLIARWNGRPALVLNSAAGRYLHHERTLPRALLLVAARAGVIRQGPHGSTWFRHDDDKGGLTGWEERGPQWRGFASGGTKTLFRFGKPQSPRVCITEAAIDALSLAAIERLRIDTLYTSTGGGWSPSTVEAIEGIAGAMLVAATDADPQGEVYADRLRHIAERTGRDFIRLRPQAVDWNEDLRRKQE